MSYITIKGFKGDQLVILKEKLIGFMTIPQENLEDLMADPLEKIFGISRPSNDLPPQTVIIYQGGKYISSESLDEILAKLTVGIH